MSAVGTKRTIQLHRRLSAIGGKADMTVCAAKCPLMTQSGHDPLPALFLNPIRCPVLSRGGGNEAARVHHPSWRRGGEPLNSPVPKACRCAKFDPIDALS
jgi:hypothetical protein